MTLSDLIESNTGGHDDKSKIKNKMGYLTNAIKKNQRSLEWRQSDELKSMCNLESIVDEKLKADAQAEYPNDALKQELYYNDYYLNYIGKEMRRIKQEFK